MSRQIVYAPSFSDRAMLETYLRQASWHFRPLNEDCRIVFHANCNIENLEIGSNIEVRTERLNMRSANYILFWQSHKFWEAPAHLRRKALIVDEFAQQAVGDKLDTFVSQFMDIDIDRAETAYRNFRKTLHSQTSRVRLIGSGPRRMKNASPTKDAINIFLGTAIFSKDLRAAYYPDIIVAADGPSQFGHSKTAERFRVLITEILLKGQSHLIIPMDFYPNVVAGWNPNVIQHIIPLPQRPSVPSGNKLSEVFAFEPTSNVLTSLGLPLAADLSDSIDLIGITLPRTANDEDVHWTHIDEAIYQRHVCEIISLHPASILDDPNYINRHLARLNTDLDALTQKGITLTDEAGRPYEAEPSVDDVKQGPPQYLIRLFKHVAYLENRPALTTALTFLGTLIPCFILYSLLETRVFNILLASGLFTAVVLIALFLRLRVNRMMSKLESRLSRQQAHQFNNLSIRLQKAESELGLKPVSTKNDKD